MARILKLVALDSYIGPLTKTGEGTESALVKRGEVVLFDDADADSALSGHNIDREGREVPYFDDVTDSYEGKIDHDLTTERRNNKRTPVRDTAALDAEARKNGVEQPDSIGAAPGMMQPDPAAAQPEAKSATTQRVPRKTTAK